MSASWKQGNRRATTSGKAGTRTKWIEPRLPTESVKYLALGIFRHEVFTSGQVEEKEQHLLPSIFPSLHSFTNERQRELNAHPDRKSTRLNSSHLGISYAVFCFKKKQQNKVIVIMGEESALTRGQTAPVI